MPQFVRLGVVHVLDGHRIEQPDEAGEGPHLAVVGRGAGQDQRVGALRQEVGQRPAVAALPDEVVRLVDDNCVPVDVLQPWLVALRILDRVHGDDHALVVGEGVAPRRDTPFDAGDANAVQPHQRKREPCPHLVLELLQHRGRRYHEDPLTTPTPHQLTEQHPDLQGLAEPHHVADQQAWPKRVGQCLLSGAQLVVHAVEQESIGQCQALLGLWQGRPAHDCLQEEAAAPKLLRGIGHQPGALRTQHPGLVQGGEEAGLVPSDQVGGTGRLDQVLAFPGLADAPDQPVLVAHLDDGADGDPERCGCADVVG